MKALFTFKPAINQTTVFATIILISLVSVIYPEISLADYSLQAKGQNSTALVFEIKNSFKTQTQSSLTIKNIQNQDPLPDLLAKYLKSYNSPLVPYSQQIIQLNNWKKALAISFVESHMGQFCADNNCSGMGGSPSSPSWRKYETKLDWFVDLNQLLNKPIYSERFNTCQKMKGVYVQPGSPGWVHGCEKIYSELTNLEEQANQLKIAQIQNSGLALANTNGLLTFK
jgi:hypothetical protein